MANTYVDYIATQGQRNFSFNFPFLEVEHVKVYINNIGVSNFTVSTSPATEVVLGYDATAGDKVRVRRESDPATNLVDFENGSVLTESELDRGYLHNRYLAEEAYELRTGPTGAQGVPGGAGPPGPNGPSAYEVFQLNGGTSSEQEWLDSLVGPGSTVAGPPGPEGDSAYDSYRNAGGTLSEVGWLASLAGAPSTAAGPPGPSAYQSYVTTAGPNPLSETDWLASLEGPPGQAIIGPAGLNWMGEWSSTVTYAIDDAVYEPNSGSSYIAISANTNSRPPNSNWTLLTAQGDQGPPGPDGATAYEVYVNNGGTDSVSDWLASLASTVPGPPGASAYEIAFAADPSIGSITDWLASLVGPASTVAGPPGPSAYAVAQSGGFTGTQSEWLDSLAGEDGNPSTEPGPPGASAYQSYVDNVPNGEPVLSETEWLATLVGAASTTEGPPGPSAYEVFQLNGGTSSEQEWLDSLIGPPGLESTVPGPPGQNVYDWALENNLFSGSEEDFLDSLQSTIPGPDGPSAYDVYVTTAGPNPLSETGWLDSLVGSPGPPGPAGQDGSQGLPRTQWQVRSVDGLNSPNMMALTGTSDARKYAPQTRANFGYPNSWVFGAMRGLNLQAAQGVNFVRDGDFVKFYNSENAAGGGCAAGTVSHTGSYNRGCYVLCQTNQTGWQQVSSTDGNGIDGNLMGVVSPTIVDNEVFSQGLTNSWTTVSTGYNNSLVMLLVEPIAGAAFSYIYIKKKGDSNILKASRIDNAAGGGCAAVAISGVHYYDWRGGYCFCVTDSSGDLEIASSSGTNVTITVIGHTSSATSPTVIHNNSSVVVSPLAEAPVLGAGSGEDGDYGTTISTGLTGHNLVLLKTIGSTYSWLYYRTPGDSISGYAAKSFAGWGAGGSYIQNGSGAYQVAMTDSLGNLKAFASTSSNITTTMVGSVPITVT